MKKVMKLSRMIIILIIDSQEIRVEKQKKNHMNINYHKILTFKKIWILQKSSSLRFKCKNDLRNGDKMSK